MAHEITVLAGRNARIMRGRGLAVAVINPLIFFAAFYLVLHRALVAHGVDFGLFFPPGIVVESAGLLAISTATFTARDRRSGLLTRYRTLPIRGSSVLAGKLAADAAPAVLAILVVIAAGLGTGFRFRAGVPAAIGFVLLAAAFAVALSAAAGVAGLRARHAEAVASMLFVLMLPLINFSAAFVPAHDFPGWLQPVVRVNPFSVVAEALRALAGGGPLITVLWHALAWIAALAAVSCWLAAQAFRRIT